MTCPTNQPSVAVLPSVLLHLLGIGGNQSPALRRRSVRVGNLRQAFFAYQCAGGLPVENISAKRSFAILPETDPF